MGWGGVVGGAVVQNCTAIVACGICNKFFCGFGGWNASQKHYQHYKTLFLLGATTKESPLISATWPHASSCIHSTRRLCHKHKHKFNQIRSSINTS
jgi:hypothetical protein